MIYINPAYEQIWQCSCESLYAKPASWLDSILIEERERVYKALIRHHEQLDNFKEEYRILRGDGTMRWISARSTPVFNERLKLYRFVGIAEDITERKLAEEALRKNERRLQYLYSELQAISKAETEEHARRLTLLQRHLEIEWLIEPEVSPAIEKENSVERLIPPSHEKMMILLDLVKKGNIRRLMAQADKLKQLDQQYHPFASKLRLLAQEIKLKELRDFLEDYMKYQTEKGTPLNPRWVFGDLGVCRRCRRNKIREIER